MSKFVGSRFKTVAYYVSETHSVVRAGYDGVTTVWFVNCYPLLNGRDSWKGDTIKEIGSVYPFLKDLKIPLSEVRAKLEQTKSQPQSWTVSGKLVSSPSSVALRFLDYHKPGGKIAYLVQAPPQEKNRVYFVGLSIGSYPALPTMEEGNAHRLVESLCHDSGLCWDHGIYFDVQTRGSHPRQNPGFYCIYQLDVKAVGNSFKVKNWSPVAMSWEYALEQGYSEEQWQELPGIPLEVMQRFSFLIN